jgi:pimeloyl-[acyl-carrier protein] synthase
MQFDAQNPYPYYEWLRAQGNICAPNGYAHNVTGYDEAMQLLRHPDVSADKFSGWTGHDPVLEMLSRQMVFADPPDHTRLRALVTRAFTPRVIDEMRATIVNITQELLDAMSQSMSNGPVNEQMDIVQRLAYPLPIAVIAEMLGVPIADRAQFKRWSGDFFMVLDGGSPEAATPSLREFTAYIKKQLTPLRQNPREDLLSALATAQEQNDKLTDDELIANALLLLAAGHETTTNLIASGVYLLLSHGYTSLPEGAVDEILRFESPVQTTGRVVKKDITIGNTPLKKDDYVNIFLGAANRDPQKFTTPDHFNPARQDGKHLAFGYGPHYCLGAALAKLEGEIALGMFLERFPHAQLAQKSPPWRESMVFRALERLTVTL